MHPTHNTLPLAIREQALVLLNRHLAAAIDLHGQLNLTESRYPE
jgi:starvation-inducible DNA-binding protein